MQPMQKEWRSVYMMNIWVMRTVKVQLTYSKVIGLDIMVIEFGRDQAALLNCARSKSQKEGRMMSTEDQRTVNLL